MEGSLLLKISSNNDEQWRVFFFCIDWKIEDVVTYRKKEEVEGERKKNNLVKRVHHMAM